VRRYCSDKFRGRFAGRLSSYTKADGPNTHANRAPSEMLDACREDGLAHQVVAFARLCAFEPYPLLDLFRPTQYLVRRFFEAWCGYRDRI